MPYNPGKRLNEWSSSLAAHFLLCFMFLSNLSSTLDYARLMGFLIKRMCCLLQLCVSKCPDRFATLLDVWNTKNWEYYKQFCKPGFEIASKVRHSGLFCLSEKWMKIYLLNPMPPFACRAHLLLFWRCMTPRYVYIPICQFLWAGAVQSHNFIQVIYFVILQL